jgi:hypothetical protein
MRISASTRFRLQPTFESRRPIEYVAFYVGEAVGVEALA